MNSIPPLQAQLSIIPRPDRSSESLGFAGTRARLQLTDGGGRPLTWRAAAFAYLSPDPDGRTLVQEPTSRWSSPNGAIVPLASDRTAGHGPAVSAALVITDDTGRLDIDLPAAQHKDSCGNPERRYLVVTLPTGPVLISPALHGLPS